MPGNFAGALSRYRCARGSSGNEKLQVPRGNGMCVFRTVRTEEMAFSLVKNRVKTILGRGTSHFYYCSVFIPTLSALGIFHIRFVLFVGLGDLRF